MVLAALTLAISMPRWRCSTGSIWARTRCTQEREKSDERRATGVGEERDHHHRELGGAMIAARDTSDATAKQVCPAPHFGVALLFFFFFFPEPTAHQAMEQSEIPGPNCRTCTAPTSTGSISLPKNPPSSQFDIETPAHPNRSIRCGCRARSRYGHGTVTARSRHGHGTGTARARHGHGTGPARLHVPGYAPPAAKKVPSWRGQTAGDD